MPFNNEFIANASRAIEVTSVQSDFDIVSKFIRSAIEKIAEKSSRFKPRDVEIYIHGSYANKTNVYFPSNLEICVELKKTTTYDPSKLDEYRLYSNYYVAHNLDLGPKQFRDLLFEALSEATGEKCTEHNKIIVIPMFGKLKHIIEITPCFSFEYLEPIDKAVKMAAGAAAPKNLPVFRGVLLHDAGINADIVTFPRLHAQNGNAKDIACNGNFKKCVRFFKSINAINARENETEPERGYFIECLLFNVPNKIFLTNVVGNKIISNPFEKIINYLSHCDLSQFVCQNLVWHLFGNATEFWQYDKAESFIKSMKQFYKKFPKTRTLLA